METTFYDDDQLLVRLAREIAMDHFELDEILKRYCISTLQWERIREDKYFTSILAGEMLAWNAANNTHERSKLKAAAVIEDWLPEAHKMLHARGETLSGRVALAQLLTKIAGMGVTAEGVNVNGGGERFVININLGGGKDVKVEKVINANLNEELGVIEEEAPPRLTEMQKRAQSGGGVPVLNPLEIVKKW
jgi:hypothetical protein